MEALAAALFLNVGWVFPARDLPILLALGLALARRRRAAWVAGALALALLALRPVAFAAVAVAGAGVPPPGPGLRVAFANIWRENPDLEGDLARLLATAPDALFLTEADAATRGRLAVALAGMGAAAGGHGLRESAEPWMPRAVIARVAAVPATDLSARDGLSPAVQPWRVPRACGGPVVVLLMHLGSPLAGGQGAQLEQALAPRRGRAAAETLVVGDFNAVPGAAVIADAEAALGVQRIGDGLPSFLPAWAPWRRATLPMFGVRIDHALVGPGLEGAAARLLPLAGSDHHALVVDLPDACAAGRD